MFEILLLDLDNTILDFDKAEHVALCKTLSLFGIEPTDTVCTRYSQINKEHWERLERKELTREQVLVGRFQQMFRELGIQADAVACKTAYAEFLSVGHYFLPDAPEALERLSKKYRLFLASNGTASVQWGRLNSAGICHYFEDIFISQEMGANKPAPEFFSSCFQRIRDFDPAKAMIVGDSLSSDILGGRNAGIATCWVNKKHAPGNPEIPSDYEIESLAELYPLLERL